MEAIRRLNDSNRRWNEKQSAPRNEHPQTLMDPHRGTELSIGWATLAEYRYSAASALPAHSHVAVGLNYFEIGGATEVVGRDTREVTRHSAMLYPSRFSHAVPKYHGDTRLLHMDIDRDWVDAAGLTGELPVRSEVSRGEGVRHLGMRLREELDHTDRYRPLVLQALTIEFLVHFARSMHTLIDRRPPAWLARVVARLHDELDRGFTLDDLARDADVHPVHLTRTFRRVHGESISAHLRRLRIEKACNLLRCEYASLADVAQQLGFADQSHFTRSFRRVTGTTPAAFARNCRR